MFAGRAQRLIYIYIYIYIYAHTHIFFFSVQWFTSHVRRRSSRTYACHLVWQILMRTSNGYSRAPKKCTKHQMMIRCLWMQLGEHCMQKHLQSRSDSVDSIVWWTYCPGGCATRRAHAERLAEEIKQWFVCFQIYFYVCVYVYVYIYIYIMNRMTLKMFISYVWSGFLHACIVIRKHAYIGVWLHVCRHAKQARHVCIMWGPCTHMTEIAR
jgi:hypothetical protein